ncbi:MAG TPA: TIGR04002 family protein [Clostridiales bacterium]|nr:TIGR04002 family protein [Clostridiales bacterium]
MDHQLEQTELRKRRPPALWRLVIAAMLCAMMAAVTLVRIPAANGNYFHLGDSMVYLAAALLPTGYAVATAALGGALADLLAGAPVWIIATVPIKAALALLFTSRGGILVNRRNIIACFLAIPITCGGYYLAEGLFFGNWVAPLAMLPLNLLQAVAGGIVFLAIATLLDRSGFTRRFWG